MGFKTRGISQKTHFKRHPSASGRPSSSGLTKLPLDMNPPKRMKWTHVSSLSPTAAPFNSTSFLIWQKSQQRESKEAPGVGNEYGSNVGNMITCCPFTHNRDCHHQPQVQHPMIVKGKSNPDSLADVSLLHLQFQELHVTDSDSDMEVDTACDPGDSALKHRRVRSFTDDNFEMFDYSNVQYDTLERELLEDPKTVCDYKIF